MNENDIGHPLESRDEDLDEAYLQVEEDAA
jgi:hypothetical protein